MRLRLAMAAVGASVLLGGATTPPGDPVLEGRLASYLAGGWDPLTVPVAWYSPVAPVAGAPRPPATGQPRRLSNAAIDRATALARDDGASALIVAENGRIVAEHYWQGADKDTRFNPQSMAKTLVALLVGIAVDRGEIASADDPIGNYLDRWRGDPRGRITIAQLLTMASGLAQIDAGHGMTMTPDNPAVRQYFGSDFNAGMYALPLAAQPGSAFDYNNNATLLLARVLQRAGGASYAELLSDRLWQPLGLSDATIYIDRPGGSAMASCCLFSIARDWIAIGRLIAGRGEIDGRRIVSARWIDAMTTPSPTARGYGYQLWLGDQQVGGTPLPPVLTPWQSEAFAARDMMFLNGFGGQRVWIMRGAGLVVVRFGTRWPPRWDDSALPNILYRGMI
jgi:CubicO group peptidase (beta-lactamase class C family)